MAYIIAVAGKGGTGKTTVASILVRLLKEKKGVSILAIDADPNSNLAESLGVEIKQTIGSILDEISAHPEKIPAGMPKERFLDYQLQMAVSEQEGFDILAMGNPEGPGCYCYVNNVLRNMVAKLMKDYDYVLIDNEAGLEHLSRRTTRSADVFVVISDATVVGLKAAKRISSLISELKIAHKKKLLLLNRCDTNSLPDKLDDLALEFIGAIPFDGEILNISQNGSSLSGLDRKSPAISALVKIGEKIWQAN